MQLYCLFHVREICIITCYVQLKAAHQRAYHVAECNAATGLQNSLMS